MRVPGFRMTAAADGSSERAHAGFIDTGDGMVSTFPKMIRSAASCEVAVLRIGFESPLYGEIWVWRATNCPDDYALAAKIIEGDEGKRHTSLGTYARTECFLIKGEDWKWD